MGINNVSTTTTADIVVKRLETSSSASGTVNIGSTSTLVRPENPNRSCLYITNTGSEWISLDHQANAVFGQGIMLSPGGGVYCIESGNLDKRLVHAICGAEKSSSISWYEGSGEEVSQT